MIRSRRSVFALGMAILVGVLAVNIMPAPCFFGCDVTLSRDEAEDWVTRTVAAPLPHGVSVPILLLGGFQDKFVQIRLEGPTYQVPVVLEYFGVSLSQLAEISSPNMTASTVPWWTVDEISPILVAPARIPGFDAARLAIAPNAAAPGLHVFFLFAHQI